MRIITTAAIKGGTGKTATAAALAQAAAADGKRVLAIDLDPQANMTVILGADPNRYGVLDLLHGTPAQGCIQTVQGIAVMAGNRNLANETTGEGSANRLRDGLKPLQKLYDICIIDTPPMLGELVYNALNASTGLLVPLESDTSSLQGLYQICDLSHQIRHTNKLLRILGCVITRYDGRPKINGYIKDTIAEKGKMYGCPLLKAIRSGVAVRESAAMQQSLFQYAPHSKPAEDYMELYRMITDGTLTQQEEPVEENQNERE